MRCKLCHSADTVPLPFAVPEYEGQWVRCRACGSDSNSLDYDHSNYGPDNAARHRNQIGGAEVAREALRSNAEWFGHHHQLGDDRSFLDVGCADGSGLDVMQSLGWSVHGFDVDCPDYGPAPHLTIAPVFHRWLFPQRFAAVMARETIEHVPTPDLFLHDLHGVTRPGGLVQVQTPKPGDDYHPNVYQRTHLFLFSTKRLREMLSAAMLDVIDSREWEEIQPGQAYLCRART